MVPPVLVTSVRAEALTHTSDCHCYNFVALVSVAVGFVYVQPGFLQLLLSQTWVKCTSLDSSRCVVYSGIRFRQFGLQVKNWSRMNGKKSGLNIAIIFFKLLLNF